MARLLYDPIHGNVELSDGECLPEVVAGGDGHRLPSSFRRSVLAWL